MAVPPDTPKTHDTTETQDEQELGLIDIALFFKRHWKVIAAFAASSTVIGALYAYLAPPQYKATLNLEMASVLGEPVEKPAVLVEKMKLPLYFSRPTLVACRAEDELAPGRNLANDLKPQHNKQAPLVSFSYVSDSPEAAAQCLDAVYNEIRDKQTELARPTIEAKTMRLKLLKEKRAATQAIMDLLPQTKSALNTNDAKFSASALLLATVLKKEEEMRELGTEIADLEALLAEPQTRMTLMAAPIYSPAIAVWPRPLIIIGVAPLIGALLGIVVLLMNSFLRTLREQENAARNA